MQTSAPSRRHVFSWPEIIGCELKKSRDIMKHEKCSPWISVSAAFIETIYDWCKAIKVEHKFHWTKLQFAFRITIIAVFFTSWWSSLILVLVLSRTMFWSPDLTTGRLVGSWCWMPSTENDVTYLKMNQDFLTRVRDPSWIKCFHFTLSRSSL